MNELRHHISLDKLEIYQLSRELSRTAWKVYDGLGWDDKKITGQQFIRSVDSVGANIAEGYYRYHYLDKIKFYYNARASLREANNHWLELLRERDRIDQVTYSQFKQTAEVLSVKLNNFIAVTYKQKLKKQ